ncbi:MAG TPA: penicillin-binding protein 2 [Acidimicrobiales bacterium]|jgi:cell division protein FtsI (penicillin-binding protein 3)|nr:penicillin-binding protein 2 [Acidimicrobiales bacterium]
MTRDLPRRPASARAVVAARAGDLSRRRLRLIRAVVLVGVTVLVLQLVNLQVVRAAHFAKLSSDQLLQNVTVPALRGSIYDRDAQILAMSIPTSMAVADDFLITDPAAEAAALAPLLGIPATRLAPKLEERNGYVVLSSTVTAASTSTLTKVQLPGISLIASSVRSNPDGSLASTILGGVDNAGLGSAGLEYEYQQLLAGQGGSERVLETPYGVSLPSGRVVVLRRPIAGKSLELTLDAPLQYVTEQALGQELVTSNGLTGTAIVLDTATGQILSMASLVNTDEHDPTLPAPQSWPASTGVSGVQDAMNNLGVTQTYEPGSVFKIVPFSAALLDHVITPTTHLSVPDQVVIDGHVFHDAEQHGLEDLTATQVLEYSSNIGTYEIARDLGESRLLAGVSRLGFGQPTGLTFPGESQGLMASAQTFSPTDIAALPIGQVDAVTPLQVLDAYNTIANGGVFVTPSLVRATIGADGTMTKAPASAARRVLPTSIAGELTQMLIRVVEGGTGIKAAIPGYTIAGKTGTASIPYPGRAKYIPGDYNATFVGFAPAQHPVLSMIVVIERPTPDFFGGDVAAPVFARVMDYALHRYGVPAMPGMIVPSGNGGSVSLFQDVT